MAVWFVSTYFRNKVICYMVNVWLKNNAIISITELIRLNQLIEAK